MTEQIKLPPLTVPCKMETNIGYWDDEAMQSYARAAVLADRQTRAMRNIPPLFDGALSVPCTVQLDPLHQQYRWLFIPHASGNWVSAAKLDGFSLKIIEYWIASQPAEPAEAVKEPT